MTLTLRFFVVSILAFGGLAPAYGEQALIPYFLRKISPGQERLSATQETTKNWSPSTDIESFRNDWNQIFDPVIKDGEDRQIVDLAFAIWSRRLLELQEIVDRESIKEIRGENSKETASLRTKAARQLLANELADLYPDLPPYLLKKMAQLWRYDFSRGKGSWYVSIAEGIYTYISIGNETPLESEDDREKAARAAFHWSGNSSLIYPDSTYPLAPQESFIPALDYAYTRELARVPYQVKLLTDEAGLPGGYEIIGIQSLLLDFSDYQEDKRQTLNPYQRFRRSIAARILLKKNSQYFVLYAFGERREGDNEYDLYAYEQSDFQNQRNPQALMKVAGQFSSSADRLARWTFEYAGKKIRLAVLDLDRSVVAIDSNAAEGFGENSELRIRSGRFDNQAVFEFAFAEDPAAGLVFIFNQFKRGREANCEVKEEHIYPLFFNSNGVSHGLSLNTHFLTGKIAPDYGFIAERLPDDQYHLTVVTGGAREVRYPKFSLSTHNSATHELEGLFRP